LHLVGILFPHIDDDAQSKSHQISMNTVLFSLRVNQPHFHLASNLKTSGAYQHGPSVLFLVWWFAVEPTLFLGYIIERLWVLWTCSPYFSPSWLNFISFSLNLMSQQLVLTCKKWGTDTISYKQTLHIMFPHSCRLKHN